MLRGHGPHGVVAVLDRHDLRALGLQQRLRDAQVDLAVVRHEHADGASGRPTRLRDGADGGSRRGSGDGGASVAGRTGQVDDDGGQRAGARAADDVDPPAHQPDDLLAEGQAQAGAAEAGALGPLDEGAEEPLDLVGLHPGTGVGDGEPQPRDRGGGVLVDADRSRPHG